jgi:CDP-diacylglycerol---glycerol-3-phosphate 3-phosphatidyltransferase
VTSPISKPGKKLRPLRDEITDIPNVITLARVALIPLVLWLASTPGLFYAWAACVTFVIAAATDALDGYLARRLGLVTVLGKFLDPLADKLIVLSTLIILVGTGRAPAWLVVLLMARELAITGLRAVASQEGFVIAAGTGGKIKTVLQLVGIAFLLVDYPLHVGGIVVDCHQVGIWITYGSLVMSILSAVEYFRFFAAAAAKQAADLAAQGITRSALRERAVEKRAHRRETRRARKVEKKAERAQRRLGRGGRRKAEPE